MYHFVLLPVGLLTIIGAGINFYKSLGTANLYGASLILVISFALLICSFYARVFPLKAQDRVIRAEENARHQGMAGKAMDPKLTMRQIIGLRFASDEEFLALAKRAVDENLSEEAIKKAIKNWRGDFERA